MASSTRVQTENWLKTIEAKGRILDIGGAELPIKKRLKSFNPTEYKILDLETPHEDNAPVDIVFDLNYEGEDEMDFGFSHCHYEHYNIAFAIEVYEHCWNPVRALQNTNWFLKEGGLLYATFPWVYPHHNPPEQDYLRYTKWGCEKILEETGFEILEMENRHSTKGSLLKYYSDEQMRPTKKADEVLGWLHESTAWMVKAKKL